MSSISDFLTGTRILEEVISPINGKISVIKSMGYGTYVQVKGLTQSGGVVNSVWKRTLRKVKCQKSNVKSCLILGLGAGSAAKLVNKYWPGVKITGIEIDPVMVELGKKYLGLDELGVNIIIEDALKVSSQRSKVKGQKYDLVLVDMYVGDKVPKKFETREFITRTRNVLDRSGVVVFNRLYYGEKRTLARKFGSMLENHFAQVIYHYPEANLMFICKK